MVLVLISGRTTVPFFFVAAPGHSPADRTRGSLSCVASPAFGVCVMTGVPTGVGGVPLRF